MNEDDEWPGLAHLMEHLLFCGSEGFSAREGLMSWVPAQGGQLNATTRLNRSAFFFQVPPPTLEAGLHRLCDMLASPLTQPAGYSARNHRYRSGISAAAKPPGNAEPRGAFRKITAPLPAFSGGEPCGFWR
nr:insulinase family protein [Cedecea lapagei]